MSWLVLFQHIGLCWLRFVVGRIFGHEPSNGVPWCIIMHWSHSLCRRRRRRGTGTVGFICGTARSSCRPVLKFPGMQGFCLQQRGA